MTLLRARLADERGWALLTSILVVGILLALSLPLLSLVDTQQAQTANERKSESSFNLAEGALDAAVFVLGKSWPAVGAGAYPPSCTPASTELTCPSADMLSRTYTGGDYSDPSWSVQVRDDILNSDGTATDYYDPTRVPAQPRYDANGNGKMWVRADAHAAEGQRSLVILVKRIDTTLPFPRNAITAGWFVVTTGGAKVVVDTKGDTVQPAPVAVRCTVPAPSPRCLEYRPGQVSPDTVTTGYGSASVMTSAALEGMRATAKALGSYHPDRCPQFPDGELVFVENGDCNYAGGSSANSPDDPGMFIVANGTVDFGGSMTYYGMVYAANLQGSTDEIVTIRGAATVVGAIAADGGGGVRVGSNGENVVYDDTIFPLIRSFSAAAPVQGSWRELPSS